MSIITKHILLPMVLRFLGPSLLGIAALAFAEGRDAEVELINGNLHGRETEDDVVSVEEQYDEAITAFRDAIAKSRGTHLSPQKLDKQFKDSIAEIIESRKLAERNLLSAGDLSALAECYEHLGKHGDAIECATMALRKDPDEPAPLFPLLRCLINQNNHQKANAQLKNAKRQFPELHDLYYFDAFLSQKAIANGEYEAALSHSTEFLDHQFKNLGKSLRFASAAVEHLDILENAPRVSRPHITLTIDKRQVYFELAREAGKVLESKPEHESKNQKLQRSLHLSWVYDLMTRTIDRSSSIGAEDTIWSNWITHIVESLAGCDNDPYVVVETARVVTEVDKRSGSGPQVDSALLKAHQVLTEEMPAQGQSKLSEIAAEVAKVRDVLMLRKRYQELVGDDLDVLSDADWISDVHPAESSRVESGYLVVIWKPHASSRHVEFAWLRDHDEACRSNGVTAVILVPYTGFQLSSDKRKISFNESTSEADEAKSVRDFVEILGVQLPVAMISQEVFSTMGMELLEFPIVVLLDRDCRVQMVEVGHRVTTTPDLKLAIQNVGRER